MPREVGCEVRISPALVRILADMVEHALRAGAVRGRLESAMRDGREAGGDGERVEASGERG